MASSHNEGPECLLQKTLAGVPQINNQKSTVHGCPVLRACPKCHALVSHAQTGCPTVWCPECKGSFCFRCLKAGYCGYGSQCPIQEHQRLQKKRCKQPQL